MGLLEGANLALRFLLELSVLAAVGYWAYRFGTTRIERIMGATVLPLVIATIWALIVAPNASITLPVFARLTVEGSIFASGVAALGATGDRRLAVSLATLALVNRLLMTVWGQ